jgi:hypothetical protein
MSYNGLYSVLEAKNQFQRDGRNNYLWISVDALVKGLNTYPLS